MSRRRVVLTAALRRALLLAATWWVVSEGSTVVGLPYAAAVVALATATSMWVSPPSGRTVLRPVALLRFAGWFVVESVRGGADVAVRALTPRLDLDPGLVTYPLRLRDDPSAAVAVADTVSLLPGTLAVEVHEDRLVVHVLDRRRDVLDGVAQAEQRIAAVLGVSLVRTGARRTGRR